MIRMNNIPEHIRNSLKVYYKENEKPDVFPSIFLINGRRYYYFTFAPAAEQLIMLDDGTVPFFNEVKREALIFNNYNISFETILHIGGKWTKSGRRDNYGKLLGILEELGRKLPGDLEGPYHTYEKATKQILDEQDQIEQAINRAREISERTNREELATEQDQLDMRRCVVDMVRAAYRQNEIQLQTEKERDMIWDYVASNRFSVGIGTYFKLKKYQKNMMKNTPENKREAEEKGKMVLGEDLPLEQHENAQLVWKKLRNPR